MIEEAELLRDSFGRLLRALSEAADRLTEELEAAGPQRPGPGARLGAPGDRGG